jgi:predicted ATPase/class 3 adenylate cyclase
MNCPACQTHNRNIARFCRACGTWLLPRCPFCNAEIPTPSVFCDQCGRRISESASQRVSESVTQQISNLQLPITNYQLQNNNFQSPISNPSTDETSPLRAGLQSLIPAEMAAKLTTARAEKAMEGQRRVVTMLFCDVKGSTEAASRLDPEEWAGIINGAFECMIAPVYHYEGTVARLMGDGILAFFGAPIAHEDDPLRAVLAGLEILENVAAYKDKIFDDWGIEMDARAGINTGLVVVGAVGSDLQVEYSALGDAINIAARMEQTAMPGTVQISDETHKLIAPLFEFEDLGNVQVKGKAEPVHTYRPLRPKAAPGRLRGIEGLESPTIGRENEMATLQTTIENLGQHGVGGILFLTGEAGMGKSRLIQEAHLAIKRSQFNIKNFEIAPLSFEASQPYALFRSFLRQITGVDEMDSAEEARSKLSALAERLPVEVRAGVTSAFASVLGVQDVGDGQPAGGESFKRQLFATARETIHVQFAEFPSVIILDDLHWADPASLEIFNHLFPLVETVPILFLCATRPERDAPVWQVKASLANEYPHRFVEILVRPLTADDSNALVDHLLTVADLPPRIRAMILNKSEGNPFFLEEIIRALIDDGSLIREDDTSDGQPHWHMTEDEVSTLIIPDNLQTLLAARLDRLADDTRHIVQVASVIGRTFYYRVLQNITETLTGLDGQLSTLQRMNMVVEAARLPELEYAFRHALVQETAYRSILLKQRREFHRRVGEAIEELFSPRLDEYAPILAMHFERGGDDAKALHFYVLAGDVAFRLYATTEAIGYYGKAIEIVKHDKANSDGDEASLAYLYTRKGRALEMGGMYDDALKCYLEMEELAHTRNDRSLELAALVARTTVHAAPTGKLDGDIVETLSQQALSIAEELGDYPAQAKIYWNLMLAGFFVDKVHEAFEAGQKSLAIARKYNLREQLAYTLNDIQRVYLVTGKIEEGIEGLKESQALWRELGNKNMLADNLASSALFSLFRAEYENVRSSSLEALKISQEIGNLWGQSYSQYTLSFLYAETLEVDEAIQVMQNSIRLGEQAGFIVPLVDINVMMGLLYAFLGDFEKGLEYAQLASYHTKKSLPAYRDGPISARAIVHFIAGNLSAIEDVLADSPLNPLKLEFNSSSAFLRVIAESCRLTANRQYSECVDLTGKFIDGARERNILFFLAQVMAFKGLALLALGRLEEARQTLLEARTIAPFSRRNLLDILPALSEIENRMGHPSEAYAFMEEARGVIQYVLDHLSNPGLRASFLARREIQSILQEPST